MSVQELGAEEKRKKDVARPKINEADKLTLKKDKRVDISNLGLSVAEIEDATVEQRILDEDQEAAKKVVESEAALAEQDDLISTQK